MQLSAAVWACWKAPLFNMYIRRAELCIARALAGPLNRLLRHGGGWLFWGVWGASGLHMLGRYQKRYTQPPAGERQAAAPPHVGGWVGRLGTVTKSPAAGGAMARPKRRSRRACLSFNNLQKFFFRGNRGLFRLRLGVTPPVSNTGGKLPQISNSGPFCFAFGVTTSGFCFR